MEGADEFQLRPLSPGDSFTSLKTGDAAFGPLKTFARKHAQKYEKANLARTYVLWDAAAERVAAFVTLVCSDVASKNDLLEGEGYPYEHYPAVKIARLLVDARYRDGRGFGRMLVDFSLGIARQEICPAIGCRFVVVDAKQESVKFYEKQGFTAINTEENLARPEPVMFIDLHKTTVTPLSEPQAANDEADVATAPVSDTLPVHG